MNAILVSALVLFAVSARAATEPVIQPAPLPATDDPLVTVELPFLPQPILPVPLDAMERHVVPDAKGRPATYVATEGVRGPLTENEQAKLDHVLALRGGTKPAPAPAPLVEVIPGVTPSPAAGVGPDVPVVQEIGPPGLTAYEREKRDAALARPRARQDAAPPEGE